MIIKFITGYGYDIEEGKLYNEKLKEILKREDVLLIQIGAIHWCSYRTLSVRGWFY